MGVPAAAPAGAGARLPGTLKTGGVAAGARPLLARCSSITTARTTAHSRSVSASSGRAGRRAICRSVAACSSCRLTRSRETCRTMRTSCAATTVSPPASSHNSVTASRSASSSLFASDSSFPWGFAPLSLCTPAAMSSLPLHSPLSLLFSHSRSCSPAASTLPPQYARPSLSASPVCPLAEIISSPAGAAFPCGPPQASPERSRVPPGAGTTAASCAASARAFSATARSSTWARSRSKQLPSQDSTSACP
eukprot:scaffold7204_cov102-Isochrysis_galbana.AAC.4